VGWCQLNNKSIVDERVGVLGSNKIMVAHSHRAGLAFGHVDHVDHAVHMDIWGGLENGPHMVHMVVYMP
jgi:hypothetical protein